MTHPLTPTRLNPVSLPFGKQIDLVAEFAIAGPLPLAIIRSFKPAFATPGPLGPLYRTPLDLTITDGPDPDTYAVTTIDGIDVIFNRPAPQLFAQSGNSGHKHLSLEPLSRAGLKLNDGARSVIYRRYPGRIWQIERIEDRNGSVMTLERDRDGILLALHHPNGLRLEFLNRPDGLRAGYDLLSPDGTRQPLLRYDYDAEGRLILADNACGESWHYAYDATGHRLMSDNGAGTRTRHIQDDSGRIVQVDTGGSYKGGRIDYAPHGRQVTVWHGADGHFEKIWFDDQGRQSFSSDPLGQFSHKRYSDDHELIEQIDPNGNATRFGYDANGNLQSVIDPEGRENFTVWNEDGQPLAQIAPDGQTWRYSYDDNGTLIGILSPLGHMTDIISNAAGQPTQIMRHDGLIELRNYDDRQRLISLTDFNSASTQFTYDDFNRLIAVTDPQGNTTRLAYDPIKGKDFWTPSRIIRPDGVEIRRDFHPTGMIKSLTDGEGRTTQYRYGPYNVLEEITDPKGHTLRFQYDSQERLTRVTNQMGLNWTFERDLAGRVIRETDFDGRELRYTYDPGGRVIRRDNPDGSRLEYDYDKSGLLTELRAFAPGAETPETTTYAYDGNGALIRASNAAATIELERDALGRVVAETQNGTRIESEIDCCGRRVRRQIGDQVLHLAYDGMGGLRRWQLEGHAPLEFQRNPAGQEISRRSAEGFALHQDWDAVGQLRSQRGWDIERHYSWSRAYDPLAIADKAWGEKRYDYDPNGQITRTLHGDAGVERFGYTPDLNLAATGDAEKFQRWQTSAAGVVRLARGPRGETIALEHDACGRVVRRRISRDGFRPQEWRFDWNAQDQLVRAHCPDGAVWTYAYDPFGRRILKSSPESETRFIWDGDVLALESVWRDYQQTEIAWFYEPDTFRPMARVEAGKLLHIVNDHLGTPKEAVDPKGRLVWSADHDTWGTLRHVKTWRHERAELQPTGQFGGVAMRSVPAGPDANLIPIRFQGQWEDAETGLYYNRFRYYEPGVGQYMSADPIGINGGYRANAYVISTAIWTDVLGLNGFGSGKGTHTANVRVCDKDGKLKFEGPFQSGNMTPEERALGFPLSTLATHTEYRAVNQIPLDPGDIMIIEGQYPPCNSCKGQMNKAASIAGATIQYLWNDGGKIVSWMASCCAKKETQKC